YAKQIRNVQGAISSLRHQALEPHVARYAKQVRPDLALFKRGDKNPVWTTLEQLREVCLAHGQRQAAQNFGGKLGRMDFTANPEYRIGVSPSFFASEGGQKDVAPNNVVSCTCSDRCCAIRAAVCSANCSCARRCGHRWIGRRSPRRIGRGGHRRAYCETR